MQRLAQTLTPARIHTTQRAPKTLTNKDAKACTDPNTCPHAHNPTCTELRRARPACRSKFRHPEPCALPLTSLARTDNHLCALIQKLHSPNQQKRKGYGCAKEWKGAWKQQKRRSALEIERELQKNLVRMKTKPCASWVSYGYGYLKAAGYSTHDRASPIGCAKPLF